MMKQLKLFVCLFAFPLLLSSAEARTIETKTFQLELPEGWEDNVDLFGLPHVYLGPVKKFKRPSLGVIPSGNKEINLTGPVTKETTDVFNQNKKDWVTQHKGKIIHFMPYEKMKTTHIDTIHKFGAHYIIGQENFKEFSYYFYCDKELFHVKSLAADKDSEGSKQLDQIVDSLRCKK